MTDCPHNTLHRMEVTPFYWYKCRKCGQWLKAQEWDGKLKVTFQKPAKKVEQP
jgi:hypothetical protein